ncbi:ATP-binding protein [Streptacidiphilus sp. N1-12]|uniref:ATP-binding protein n=2 Tax=Streptacidiphilus alkalitolerans TaxID=3342712 RepID=A0ABV6V8X0_9ACTN
MPATTPTSARGPYGFRVLPSPVEVTDADTDMPHVANAGWDSTRDRGLLLVDALAAEWGAEPEPGGKRVWFEVGDDAATCSDKRLTALVRAATSSIGTHAALQASA